MTNKILKEEDIRPYNLMQDQNVMMTIDIGRLLTKRDEFVNVDCPACGQNNFNRKYIKYNLDYVECKNCLTLYMNPRPCPSTLDWFYKGSMNYKYWNNYIFPATEENRLGLIFIPRVDRVLEICDKHKVSNDSLLEVGCAFGTFCVEMASRNKFKRIVGIEPTPDLAHTSREKGIEVIEEMIENIELNEIELFDVIVSFEVIEHIFSPFDFILNCKRMLKKNGILLLTCPNGKGFDFIILGEKCNSLDHEHLNYFNTVSLPHLLERCGFEILEVLTPGKLDAELVRKKILNREFDVSNQNILQIILIDKWETIGSKFQDFLSSNNLSSNLWVVAKNK